VDDARVRDEIKRFEHHRDRDRAREIIAKYEEGFAHYRRIIEDLSYEIGRLDERLGG
jgi:hypothetical protein